MLIHGEFGFILDGKIIIEVEISSILEVCEKYEIIRGVYKVFMGFNCALLLFFLLFLSFFIFFPGKGHQK